MIVQCRRQKNGDCGDDGEFCFFGAGAKEVDKDYYMFEHLNVPGVVEYFDYCEIVGNDVAFVKLEGDDPQCISIW